ncbi:glycine cleavage system protein R [Kiloniella sp. b19]|uniref:glycine cleavage system protein R n=1 Tax=Kiloniella sp. GXU_MW_B19 TaxID=3141326 RepID=UPI0031DB9F69
MAKTLVLTVIGPDKAGLVDQLSAAISNAGASWLESRMSNLSGYFAGILRVSVPNDKNEGLKQALASMEKDGLRLVIESELSSKVENPHREISMEIVGPDHPGIIHDIAHALAERKINILELASEVQNGAMSGEDIFIAHIAGSVPEGQDMDELHDQLSDLANKLLVDISLDDLEGNVTQI